MIPAEDMDAPCSGVYRRETRSDAARLADTLSVMRLRAVRMGCVPALEVLLDALLADLASGLGVRGEHVALLRLAAERYGRLAPGNPLQIAYADPVSAIDAAGTRATSCRREASCNR